MPGRREVKVMRPRHLAVFLPSVGGGGAERVFLSLANGLSERGHQVDLILARAEGPYLKDVSKQVSIINLDKGRISSSLLPLVNYLRRARPDVLLSAMTHVNIIAVLARMLAASSAVLAVSERASLTNNLPASLKETLIRALIRPFYHHADVVVCPSKGIEEQLQHSFKLNKRHLITIYNPLDIEKIQLRMADDCVHPWMSDSGAPVILAVGRLAAQKDYPNLISAFGKLRASRPARLVILGEGDAHALKQLVQALNLEHDVAFVGFQENPYSWIARCHLFVLSSASEGLPNVLLEALACGARVVSTDCPTGPNEILEAGRWGALVPVRDPEALAKAMAEALDGTDPPDGRLRANDFAMDRVLDRYEHVLFGRFQ
jgi:glycosyltransferase involved in cell wall biosynthesis